MTNEETRAWQKELADLTVDELNARNEELEAQKHAARAKQLAIIEVRARRMRADRMESAGPAQHAKAGVAEVKGKAVR